MKKFVQRKSLFQKQMPTLLGISVLVIALVAGLLLFGQGTGVFAPRASAETTPKNIRLSNVTDTSFTVSFFTDDAVAGFVRYGTEPNKLNSQASDDRAQLSGSVSNQNVHHITVRGLKANTTYYYNLGTGGSNTTFNNQGAPFTVTTAVQLSQVPESKMIYGNVYNDSGTPADGSVVYANIPGAGLLSSLVRNTGSWGIALSIARTLDGKAFATYDNDTLVELFVQGNKIALTASESVAIAQAQPTKDIALGGNIAGVPTPSVASIAPTEMPDLTDNESTAEASVSASLLSALEADNEGTGSSDLEQEVSTASAILVLSGNDIATPSAVVNEQPVIRGQAVPNVEVRFEIHSDNQIHSSVVADENGEFHLDLAALGESLEPGQHTVTYSYIDPATGEEVTRTETFIVEGRPGATTNNFSSGTSTGGSQLAQATTYGSGNPYTTTRPTATPTITNDLSGKGGATRSAVVSTSSGTFNAGSFETTLVLAMAGFFLMTAGIWSWWLAVKTEERK